MELLISALNANPEELLKTMKVCSKFVLVNQCDEDNESEYIKEDLNGKIRQSKARGVGLSRNLCLDKSTEEIILFGDEDIIYDEGYASLVDAEFSAHPDADIILFNVRVSPERKTYWNESFESVGRFGCGRFPAYSIACKREKLVETNVKFSTLFGGGAKYSNGEDSLFLTDAIKAGLKVYKTPTVIGEETYRESTWFKGYTEKFFFDRGVLFAFLYEGLLKYLFAFRFLTKSEMYKGEIKRGKALKLILKGIKAGKLEKKSATN